MVGVDIVHSPLPSTQEDDVALFSKSALSLDLVFLSATLTFNHITAQNLYTPLHLVKFNKPNGQVLLAKIFRRALT